jgi:excisionase family DNA binding protein
MGYCYILSINTSDSRTKTDFLTVYEVAELLRLSVLTIYKYIKEGQLEAVEFGGHYRVSSDSLEKFIDIHKVGGSK